MSRWGMVIDLQRCIGCYSCQIACKQEYFLPPWIFWARVIISETGKFPAVTKEIYPVLCNHCKEAPCVDVCPTGASTKREDGIVLVDYDKCVGCRYCIMACPYQHRTYYSYNTKQYFPGQDVTEFEVIGKELYPLQKGTVVKCTFCAERLDKGIKKGLNLGVDREATPACVNACPTSARVFGDLDDPYSNVSRLIKEKRGIPLNANLGTEPSVYYIYR
ncbi:4Fe-4S dicluster domain-containing protein [Chloroflexota bacterium]